MYCALRNRAWPNGSCRHMAGTQTSCRHADHGVYRHAAARVRAAAGLGVPVSVGMVAKRSSVSAPAAAPG